MGCEGIDKKPGWDLGEHGVPNKGPGCSSWRREGTVRGKGWAAVEAPRCGLRPQGGGCVQVDGSMLDRPDLESRLYPGPLCKLGPRGHQKSKEWPDNGASAVLRTHFSNL